MKIYSIYRARNIITDESYIGFTSSTLPKRLVGHRHKAFTELSENKFYTAIREYGWNNFEWSIIYQAKEDCHHNDSHTLNVMEDHFIEEYDSIDHGYNTIRGGGKYPVLFGEENPMFNKKHKEESIELMKTNRKDTTGQIPWNKGKKHTEDHIRNVAEALRGKNRGPKSEEQKRNQSISMSGRPGRIRSREEIERGIKTRKENAARKKAQINQAS
jgi:group I intron endonuclease